MPRALVTQAVHVPAGQREAALRDLRQRRDTLESHGCHYWLFEDPDLPGFLIEFFEARDAETLRVARDRAGVARDDIRILSEVEL